MSKDNNLQNIFHTINLATLSEDSNVAEVEVLRTGVVRDRGLKITKKMLTDFVENHKGDVYGQELQVNYNHKREGEAAGWIKDLIVKGEQLFAKVEFTKVGAQKIKDKLYKFVSAEFADVKHHKTGKVVENVFVGLALTNVPALKGQSPIALSEGIQLTSKENDMFNTFIKKLSEREYVSKDDKALARQLLEELPEEEQEEHKEAVEEVEAKPEAPEAEGGEGEGGDEGKEGEGTEGKEGKEGDGAGEGEGEGSGDEGKEELTEKLNSAEVKLSEQEKKISELQETIDKKELSEKFDNDLAVSNERGVGLLAESKEKVVAFMSKLSQEDRVTFGEILSEVTAVDLETRGSTSKVDLGDMEDEVTALAEKLLNDKKAKDITEAQKMATEQLKTKK